MLVTAAPPTSEIAVSTPEQEVPEIFGIPARAFFHRVVIEPFHDAVRDLRRIERHLDRLAARADARRREALVQDGVRLADVLDDRERFVPVLARALGDGSFRPGRAVATSAFLAGKVRDMARLGILDLLAHAVVADVLAERLEPLLSASVYSYRAGRSNWQALRLVARTARLHARARPDPRTRGLYALRVDVRNYGPSIPLDEGSDLWRQLRAVTGLDAGSAHWAMLQALVRQDLVDASGHLLPRDVGILFGAPTSNVLTNLYLVPLDEALAELRGVYTRFGDDILFVHASPERVQLAFDVATAVTKERGLSLNADKVRFLFWNGAARPSPSWPEARGTAKIPFLGAAVGFDGTIALSPAKWRIALLDLRTRILGTARLLEGTPRAEKARVLAEVVNEAFEARTELALSHENMLRDLVSDRAQLRELDHLLALWVAEAVSGRRGPRAFRDVPWRFLREEAGLRSRVAARNASRR